MRKKKLPIGIDNFEKIRKNDFYYVDKTAFVTDLLNSWNEATLFTRPRRFGKSLNMSMLESFFSPLSDKSVFDGLKVMKETSLCGEYMGKYPVISITLKNVDAGDFNTAYKQVSQIIRGAAIKVDEQIQENTRIHPSMRDDLNRLLQNGIEKADLYSGLLTLSGLLEKHYKQKVIILIDEYDVPLAKAYENGYYEPMVLLIRNLCHQALKTNNSLQFAVLTGCMHISQESIFTGMNNLTVCSISDNKFDEYFGFTDDEVRGLMDYYGCAEYYSTMRNWYDGYKFGDTSVYCPWDVLMYCDKLLTDSDRSPENFWLNSSGNQVVSRLIRHNNTESVKGEIEALLSGEAIEKNIQTNLTYPQTYSSIENIWSVLYTTGYLTQRGKKNGSRIQLAIPNKEICNIFSEQLLALFKEEVSQDEKALRLFCEALKNGDVPGIEEKLNEYLGRTISIRDSAVLSTLKENFYHGLLAGILGVEQAWTITSNQESGNGYSEIQIRDRKNSLGIVIEVKYSDKDKLAETCMQGLRQIDDKHYTQKLHNENFRTILKYGIAFHLKECKVMLQEEAV